MVDQQPQAVDNLTHQDMPETLAPSPTVPIANVAWERGAFDAKFLSPWSVPQGKNGIEVGLCGRPGVVQALGDAAASAEGSKRLALRMSCRDCGIWLCGARSGLMVVLAVGDWRCAVLEGIRWSVVCKAEPLTSAHVVLRRCTMTGIREGVLPMDLWFFCSFFLFFTFSA